ncbi:MAG TPA: ABC transporter ATP-binding protein [Solirubrobacteraceae bacterium]|nr:ABC transporter ATP-binding protein [Solirubrobacteraceae bacterium]
MPAEGAMKTALEASVQEPRIVNSSAAIELEGVTRRFAGGGRRRARREPVTALEGLSLRVAEHELVAVVGPSGCGKSTLLELTCGLQQPDAGRLRSPPAVYMPQRDLLLPWLSALDNAALPLRVGAHPASRAQARARALPAFAEFGLGGFEHAMAHELSGGMRQRVAFLRTLLAGKPVLALDEPFAALDALTRQEMQRWLESALAREPRTVLLVTHDVEEAVVLGDRVIVLAPRPGRAVAELSIDLSRPRRRTDPAVLALRERALDALGVPS